MGRRGLLGARAAPDGRDVLARAAAVAAAVICHLCVWTQGGGRFELEGGIRVYSRLTSNIESLIGYDFGFCILERNECRLPF